MFFVLPPKFTYFSMRVYLRKVGKRETATRPLLRIIPQFPVCLELSDLCIFNCVVQAFSSLFEFTTSLLFARLLSLLPFFLLLFFFLSDCSKEISGSNRERTRLRTYKLINVSTIGDIDTSYKRTRVFGSSENCNRDWFGDTSSDRPRSRTCTYHPKSLIYRSRTTIAILPKRNVATHIPTNRQCVRHIHIGACLLMHAWTVCSRAHPTIHLSKRSRTRGFAIPVYVYLLRANALVPHATSLC